MSSQVQRGNRGRDTPSSRASSLSRSSRELVEEYPVASTLLAFGIGVGVGVLIGQTIAAAVSPERDSLSRLDSLSQQVRDAVRKAVPEAISRYLPANFAR
jgi:hypothetical protein